MIDGQLDIFSFFPKDRIFRPGEYVEKEVLGERLTFDEIVQEIGNLIIIDVSICSHEWYKVVRVESITLVEGGRQRRLIYYDGKQQRGLVNEMYFDDRYPHPTKAYRISEEQTGQMRFA